MEADEASNPRDSRRPFKIPIAVTGIGGLGLLGCIACCGLPLLGALGIAVGTGIATLAGLVEPVAFALLVVGLAGGLVALARFRRAAPGVRSEAASCSIDGGCVPRRRRASEIAER